MGYERFAPVERAIEISGDRYTFWQPPDLDALIDVEAFERDERIPYWANVWESALVLAEEIAGMEPGGRSLIELGCGLALPAIVACRRGFRAVASDYEDDALEGVRYNANRNGAEGLETLLLDWRRLPDDLPMFDLVVAADVLYEKTPYDLPVTLNVGDEVLIEATGAYTTTYAAVAFNGFSPLKSYVI